MSLFRTVLSSVGHVSCVSVLVTTNLLISGLDFTARALVRVLSAVTLARIEQDDRTPHAERVRTFQDCPDLVVYRPNTGANGGTGPDQVMDEEKTLAATVAYARRHHPEFFARTNDDVILGNTKRLTELAHALISHEFGGTNADLLADDFQFLFPVVGPLTKADFVEAFAQFKVREAFPTSQAGFHHFHVDPLEPNRIWCTTRGSYEHLGTLNFGPSGFPATGKRIHLPPQVFSMSFDPDGRCYKLTGGYCVDRTCGDTQGLGGMFGIVTALGGDLPFAEGRPWKRSLLWEALALRVPQMIQDWRRQSGRDNTTTTKKAGKVLAGSTSSDKLLQ